MSVTNVTGTDATGQTQPGAAIRNTSNDRASRAYALYTGVSKENRPGYDTLALKLPYMVRSAGLSAALAYLGGTTKHQKAAALLMDHLAVMLGQQSGEELLKYSRQVQDPVAYLTLAREALDYAVWIKRLSAGADT